MGLAQKIQTLQANRRSAYVNSMNLSQSAKADLLIKVERSDADLEAERRQNLCEMFHIYSERQLDPHARVTAIRREYMATDLKHCGYITHMAISKNAIITFLVEPERAVAIAQQLAAMLDANPAANLLDYEDDLEVLITKIDKSESESHDTGIYV
jgi:hypothetical protein